MCTYPLSHRRRGGCTQAVSSTNKKTKSVPIISTLVIQLCFVDGCCKILPASSDFSLFVISHDKEVKLNMIILHTEIKFRGVGDGQTPRLALANLFVRPLVFLKCRKYNLLKHFQGCMSNTKVSMSAFLVTPLPGDCLVQSAAEICHFLLLLEMFSSCGKIKRKMKKIFKRIFDYLKTFPGGFTP